MLVATFPSLVTDGALPARDVDLVLVDDRVGLENGVGLVVVPDDDHGADTLADIGDQRCVDVFIVAHDAH